MTDTSQNNSQLFAQSVLDIPFFNFEANSPFGTITFSAWDALGAAEAGNEGVLKAIRVMVNLG